MSAAGGCGSSTLPPRLTAAESARWAAGRNGFTVGVERFRYPAYSDALLRDLRGTRLFADVRPAGDWPNPPDLVARVEAADNGGVATIPIWTGLTLGVVPTVVRESSNVDFSLRRSGTDAPPWRVVLREPTTTTLGWLALPELLSPDVSWGDPEGSDRFRGRLALAILDATNRPR